MFVDLRSWCVFVIVFWPVEWLFWVYEWVHLGAYSEDVEFVDVEEAELGHERVGVSSRGLVGD